MASAVGLAAIGFEASAAPLSTLYFAQAVGWELPGAVTNGGGAIVAGAAAQAGAPAGTYTGFSWSGTQNRDYSSIQINGYGDGNSPSSGAAAEDTNGDGLWSAGERWRIASIQENNHVITGAPFPDPLWVTRTLANFRIFADAGHTTELLADLDHPATIRFYETPNANHCATPSPLSSVCDDIYTAFAIDFTPLSFVLDGYRYTIDFSVEGDPGTLVCRGDGVGLCVGAADAAPGTFRIYTPENDISVVNVLASFTVQQIPEPGSLLLVGLALVGAGLAPRRPA